jgi:hypothetical protein
MIGLALVLLLLVSCGTPAATPTPTPVPPTPTRTPLPPPISPEFPTGRFFHEHAEGYFCVFQFNEDGTADYYWAVPSVDVSSREPYVTSTYIIDGNLYTETGTDYPDCPWPATYAWTYDGQTLTFQVVGEDKCPDRQRTYESPRKYTKAE